MRAVARAHSADIERDVLRALPEHYGRAGGAQQFSRVNGWEGSSKSAFRRATGCPGVAASSTESSTHGRTGRRPPWCCRSTCEVRFASSDLPSASKTALLGARERWTPPCLVRGQGSQNVTQTQCGPGGWPGPHLFLEQLTDLRSQISDLRSQLGR
jgi:hypothetical protein